MLDDDIFGFDFEKKWGAQRKTTTRSIYIFVSLIPALGVPTAASKTFANHALQATLWNSFWIQLCPGLMVLLVSSAAVGQRQHPAGGKQTSLRPPLCNSAGASITVLPANSDSIGLVNGLLRYSEYPSPSPSPSPSTVGFYRWMSGLYDIRPEKLSLRSDTPSAIGVVELFGLAYHALVSQGRSSYSIEPNTLPGSRTTHPPPFLIGSMCDTVFGHAPCFFSLLLNGYKACDPQIESSLWETGNSMAAKKQTPTFPPPRTPLSLSPSLSAVRPSPLLSETSLSCSVTSSPLTSSPTLSYDGCGTTASPDLFDDLKYSEAMEVDFRRIDMQAAEYESIHASSSMRKTPNTPSPPPTPVRDRKTWVVFRGKTPGIYDDG